MVSRAGPVGVPASRDLADRFGPGQVLSGLLRRCDRSLRTISVNDPESLRKLQDPLSTA